MKKKTLALAAAIALLAVSGCNNGTAQTTSAAETTTTTTAAETAAEAETTAAEETTEAAEETTTAAEETTAAAEESGEEIISEDDTEIYTHDMYVAAEIDEYVVVDTYVQGKQSWWEDNGVGQASFYAQDKEDGGYFFYNMPCTKEEYDAIVPGTKLRVSGYKSEWSGEVEIVDSKFAMIEDSDTYIAEAEDVTALLGTDELIDHQNEFVAFKGMTVEAANDEGAAFMYKWDNSGSEGDDLYFNVSKDGNTYTFTVESYLCDKDSQVYQDVKALNVGDVIDLEGFLYWYEGANPHITSVTKA